MYFTKFVEEIKTRVILQTFSPKSWLCEIILKKHTMPCCSFTVRWSGECVSTLRYTCIRVACLVIHAPTISQILLCLDKS